MILPLNSPHAQLDNAGGKGANLSKLIGAGLPVPDGFIITTEAYQNFIEANNLRERISRRVTDIQPQDSSALEDASEEIRRWFADSIIPPQTVTQVVDAYNTLGDAPVAVRSSATAEDLPELSFAGQHDTYLNILGVEALLAALVNCWSSLWTARAIGYRSRNNISHSDTALAVVVQKMIPSESSGILFTANPLTGLRSEAVIDATLGLGEALVAGHVEPDHYVVDQKEQKIISKSLGSKKIAMHSKSGGGVTTEQIDALETQALPDEMIISLVELGVKVTELYEFPQDIEWGYAESELFLLQSRPITSLYPIPAGMSPIPPRVMFSFASIQGIMGPMTPLGQDTIRLIFAGGASLFGFDLTHETQGLIKIAGERLWGDITAVIHHPIGSRAAPRFLSEVDPAVQQTLTTLRDEPGLERGKGRLRFSTLRRLLRFVFPFLKRVMGYFKSPQGAADQIHQASQAEITRLREKSEIWMEAVPTLDESLDLYREIYNGFPYAVPEIASGAAAGLIPFFLLNKLAFQLTGSSDLGLEITRGLPNNVTTEMYLALWETARRIRSEEIAYQHFLYSNAEMLAEEYLENQLPKTAQTNLTKFFKRYGMRGLGEIDIGRKRWNEDPTYIIEVILNYMQIKDDSLAPDVVFKKGEQAAQQAVGDLQEVARSTFAGGLKAAAIKKLAVRVRELAGLRESPKFHIIQMMGIVRQALLSSGQELVAAGTIERPDDLFYLNIRELEELADGNEFDWRELIAKRRAVYKRELNRVQIPRLLLSDGRAFFEGMVTDEQGGTRLIGSPVSPGYAEGSVRVVLDPLNADLSPGEIMVCQGTDPAWTPLFLTADGLIMEVGGMMTHGAIVAREYGIPAVVGVHQATTILQTGQGIRLNGSTGEIYLAED
jgi:pyruvate,water dikinase